jgi:hypothetical protein
MGCIQQNFPISFHWLHKNEHLYWRAPGFNRLWCSEDRTFGIGSGSTINRTCTGWMVGFLALIVELMIFWVSPRLFCDINIAMLDGKILILDDYKTDGYIQNKYIYIHITLKICWEYGFTFQLVLAILNQYILDVWLLCIYIYTYCYLDGSIRRWFNPGWMDPWIVG